MTLRQLGYWVRKAKVQLKGWSPDRDREYHDSIFAEAHHDPFSDSYPGHITIRRFADLVSPHLSGAHHVLDLGCGTGEITCQLGRFHSGVSFEGIDHSEAGIERARANAERLELSNVSFRKADVEHFEPDRSVDVLMMLDAFHHLVDPKRFVERLGAFTKAFLLIEPRGDWKGTWNREVDFDWLVHDLEKIRARIAYATGESELMKPTLLPKGEEQGEPVEHRYTVEDFRRFFRGYGLQIRGTIAGIESYPPSPELESPSRERFGRLGYELYSEVDEMLRARNLDLLAKHLVIHAERGAADSLRAPAEKPEDVPWTTPIQGPYDVLWLSYDGTERGSGKSRVLSSGAAAKHQLALLV